MYVCMYGMAHRIARICGIHLAFRGLLSSGSGSGWLGGTVAAVTLRVSLWVSLPVTRGGTNLSLCSGSRVKGSFILSIRWEKKNEATDRLKRPAAVLAASISARGRRAEPGSGLVERSRVGKAVSEVSRERPGEMGCLTRHRLLPRALCNPVACRSWHTDRRGVLCTSSLHYQPIISLFFVRPQCARSFRPAPHLVPLACPATIQFSSDHSTGRLTGHRIVSVAPETAWKTTPPTTAGQASEAGEAGEKPREHRIEVAN